MSFCQEDASSGGSSSSFRARVGGDEEEEQAVARAPIVQPPRAASTITDISSNGSINYRKPRHDKIGSDGFWCGALRCLHLPLPGLSRRRPMQQQQSMSLSEADPTAGPGDNNRSSTVSKVVSMERFKYSSSSSGIVFERTGAEEEEEEEEEEDKAEEVSAYFDLPLELLRISSVDTELPVTTAFVFETSRGRGAKKIVPDLLDIDFSFPAPPAFSNVGLKTVLLDN